ncbi:MAG TPA: hypothetical protein VFZ16_14305 [Hyphomicrobiaceae bacterium]|nr:hypothetical protein [Hyphomicrobiaceae bacterium]
MSSAGEKTMALVDGQLPTAEVPGLVQELARNSALVEELQEYLATSRSRIGDAYAVIGVEPVPHRLIDTVMEWRAPATPRPPRRAAPLTWLARIGGRMLHWLRQSYNVPAWSLAALPALVAIAAFASALSVISVHGSLQQTDLAAALEQTPSGKNAALSTVRPMLSFNSKDAGWCRQFEMRHASRQVSHALACRKDGAKWRVVASTAPGPTGYVPAGSDRRKVIDDLATSMMRGEPLSAADEAAAIGDGWRQRL